MHKAIITLVFFLSIQFSFGQTQINIGGDFTSGIPATWSLVDGDGLTPASAVSQFGAAWIHYTDSYDTCAASTSYYDPAGQSQDYLITPKISIATHTKVTWRAKSYDASYPDGYYVMISTTDSLPSSFNDTLLTVAAEASVWTDHSLHLDTEGYANQDVFLAFMNFTDDGYILLIDDVEVYVSDFTSLNTSEVPELNIYPNPTTDYIKVTGGEFSEFVIYGVDGQVIKTSQENSINVSDLSPGIYYIAVNTENGILTRPFIKE